MDINEDINEDVDDFKITIDDLESSTDTVWD